MEMKIRPAGALVQSFGTSKNYLRKIGELVAGDEDWRKRVSTACGLHGVDFNGQVSTFVARAVEQDIEYDPDTNEVDAADVDDRDIENAVIEYYNSLVETTPEIPEWMDDEMVEDLIYPPSYKAPADDMMEPGE